MCQGDGQKDRSIFKSSRCVFDSFRLEKLATFEWIALRFAFLFSFLFVCFCTSLYICVLFINIPIRGIIHTLHYLVL